MPTTRLDPFDLTEELTFRREQTVEAARHHLETRRRVRVNSFVTVVFEDRQTLWLRMREMERMISGLDFAPARRQLDWYERLLPKPGRLLAAVWVSSTSRIARKIPTEYGSAELVLISVAGHAVTSNFRSERASDRMLGQVRWAELAFAESARDALHDPRIGWKLVLHSKGVPLESVPIPYAVVESLSEDLG